MEEFIAQHIDTYGPFAVLILLMLSGIGIPVGEDTVIIPAGVLIQQGTLPLWPTLICAYLGVCFSDLLWFTICSFYGAPLLHKKWFKRLVHPRRLLEAKHQIEQKGIWVVVMARFIPGSRTPVITMSGLLHLPYWQFMLATFSCVILTAPMQITLGYLIGAGIGSRGMAETILIVIGVVVAIPALTFGIRWFIQYRSHRGPRPRAKAKWLRRFRKIVPSRRSTATE